jgi:alpha-amylase
VSHVHLQIVAHIAPASGTTDDALSSIVEEVVAPLLRWLESPTARLAVHCSGQMLEWLDRNEPAMADRLAAMVHKGRMEWIGGGFYGPVLSVIPWRDAIGQLEMMSGYLERRTGARPLGAWLEHGAWAPRMAEILHTAGVQYAVIEPTALPTEDLALNLHGQYVTEHVGKPLILFVNEPALGQAATSMSQQGFVDHLRARLGDDGEDLTLTWLWHINGAHDVSSGRSMAWLVELLEVLQGQASWLTLSCLGRGLDRHVRRARVHPQATGGTEQPGSGWHHWLSLHGLADRMHKRMVEVSLRFAALERVLRNQGWRAMSKLSRPRRALYMAQTAFGYMGGSRGGVHWPAHRDAIYRNLIESEIEADGLVRGEGEFLETGLKDLFADLETAIVLRNRRVRAVLRPHLGGVVACLEHLPSHCALLNVLSHRFESWHERWSQSAGPGAKTLQYDGHERAGLHDRMLPSGATVAEWMSGEADLSDLAGQRYRLVSMHSEGRGSEETVQVSLAADGRLRQGSGDVHIDLHKHVTMSASGSDLQVDWEFGFSAPPSTPLDLATELNIQPLVFGPPELLLWIDGEPCTTARFDQEATFDAVRSLRFANPQRGVSLQLTSDSEMRVDWAPVRSPDPEQPGSGWIVQGVAILLRRRIEQGATKARWSVGLVVGE